MQGFIEAQRRLQAQLSAAKLWHAAQNIRRVLKANPYWHMQPRVPAGNPDGGRWAGGFLAAASSVLPILQRIGPRAIARIREEAR